MGNTSCKFGLKRLEELPLRNSSSGRIVFAKKTFPCVLTARVANAWSGWKHLFAGACYGLFQCFYSLHGSLCVSFHFVIPRKKLLVTDCYFTLGKASIFLSLTAVEFTKFCGYILTTHRLYLNRGPCKCMLIFQHEFTVVEGC